MSQASEPVPCPNCGKAATKLPSVFASKDGYTLRVPSREAFRGTGNRQ
jgi:hypothetical protein